MPDPTAPSPADVATARGPRDRLISSTIELVRARGVEGAGVSEILDRSSAARRSIYQHFPGGKVDLVAASTRAAGAWLDRRMAAASNARAIDVVRVAIAEVSDNLVDSDYTLGCPIAAAAMATPEAAAVRDAAMEVFDGWVDRLADALVADGCPPGRARSLASLTVSTVEGALLRARAARSPEPLAEVSAFLAEIYPGARRSA